MLTEKVSTRRITVTAKAIRLQRIYGLQMNKAIYKAREMVELEDLKREYSRLQMKEQWTGSEYLSSRGMWEQIQTLKASIYPTIKETVIEDPLSPEKRAEREDILNFLGCKYGTDSDQYLDYKYTLDRLAPKTYIGEKLDEGAYCRA